MRHSKKQFLFLSQKDPNVTRKISRRNFPAEKLCFYVFWAREGEGLGLLRYIWAIRGMGGPKGYRF